MNASRKACCCCSANGSKVDWRTAPVWIPPVTVKLEASAARPSGVPASAETGASPLRTAMLVTVCASAAAPLNIRVRRPIPNIRLFMAPLLRGSIVWPLSSDSIAPSRQPPYRRGERKKRVFAGEGERRKRSRPAPDTGVQSDVRFRSPMRTAVTPAISPNRAASLRTGLAPRTSTSSVTIPSPGNSPSGASSTSAG